MASEYLLQDPFHNYASSYVDHMHRRYGMRAVCFYTDASEYRLMRRLAPSRRDSRIAAQYLVDDGDWDAFASLLRQRHTIEAVIPYFEQAVGPAGRLAELLGLDWAQPGVIERFRDKHSLKEHLRSVPDGPRINAIAAVRTHDDVQKAIATGHFDRFVLKPNDGAGNYQIGFFDSDGDPALVERYLLASQVEQLLMEEYIGGEEYFANGIIDGEGNVTVWNVSRYDRREINGRVNVSFSCHTIATHEPEFEAIRDYVVEVMQATGLRRSPFHLECKIDDHGPCLIEVGARLAGTDLATDDQVAHGNLDFIGSTAHYYLDSAPFGPLGLDWSHYDGHVWGHVCGVSTAEGRIFKLEGLDLVEASPEFGRWVDKPRVGDPLKRSVAVGETPWLAGISAESVDAFLQWGNWARETIRINEGSNGRGRLDRQVLSLAPGAVRTIDRMARHFLTPRLSRPQELEER